jgi:peptidoglycan/LPS O-acetylase OafA/YrhL
MMDANTPMPGTRRGEYFEMLDGLRGVAAGAVLFGHATSIITKHTLVDRKPLAVQFFFMLSGFVVACAYEARMAAGMSVMEFYLRRAIRLYPLIVAGAVLGTFWFAISDPHFSSDPLAFLAPILAAFALPSPHTGFSFGLFPINPPEWSLFFELLAYGAFGALILRCKSRHLMTTAVAALALYSIVTIFYFRREDFPFWANSFGASASFCIGILLWRWHERGMLPRYRLPFYVLAMLLLAACGLPFEFGWGPDIVAVAVLFPILIICGAASGKGPTGRMERFLGELSYPLYILHFPILLAAKRVFLSAIGPTGTIAIACAIAVASSWVALVLFDRPVRGWLGERLLPKPRKRLSAVFVS